MKTVKFIEAEQIGFEEVDKDLVAIKMADERFMIDMDTLYDLAFRCAAFLAHIESREEAAAEAVHADSDIFADCQQQDGPAAPAAKNNSLLH